MKSLRQRITLWNTLAGFFTLSVVLVAGRLYLEKHLIRGVDLMNDAEFAEIKERIDEGVNGEAEIIEAIREHTEYDASLFFFQVGYGHGDVFFRSSNMGPFSFPKSVHQEARSTVVDEHLGKIRVAEYRFGKLDIHIASSLQNEVMLFRGYTVGALVILLIGVVASVLFSRLLARIALEPILRIQDSAQRISANNLSERIPESETVEELARLSRLLNAMFDRLKASFDQVQRFTADASHELKTPLSLIRLQAERLISENSRGADVVQVAEEQLAQIEKLNRMIEDLLLLAKADCGILKLNVEARSSSVFMNDFIEDAQTLGEEQGVKVVLKSDFEGRVCFDPVWMRHVLLNLFSNSLKVSESGGKVLFDSRREGECWVVSCMDEGPGMPEEQLNQVFNRFVRFDRERSYPGTGLGLSICLSIVKAHGGQIQAFNRTERRGLVVTLRIPLNYES